MVFFRKPVSGNCHDRCVCLLPDGSAQDIGAARPNTEQSRWQLRKRYVPELDLSAGFGDFERLAWGISKSVVDAWTKGVCGADILPIHT